jgi:hypothetical protein
MRAMHRDRCSAPIDPTPAYAAAGCFFSATQSLLATSSGEAETFALGKRCDDAAS